MINLNKGELDSMDYWLQKYVYLNFIGHTGIMIYYIV